ncbi:hypothetical protein Golax_020310, partial [Gossypium laxum]|nr:hypothetical protein [Gossypium laxum]
MVDDPLMATPDRNSKLVGKAQGIYASAAQDVVGLLMVMNLAFVEGKYNGNALSLLGQNTVFSTVREMPIVGGSDLFQFAVDMLRQRLIHSILKLGMQLWSTTSMSFII